MTRSISVKISVADVIAELEEALVRLESAIATYPADKEAYKGAIKAYNDKVAKAALKYVQNNPSEIGETYTDNIRINRYGSGRVSIEVDLSVLNVGEAPKEPENPNEKQYIGREYLTKKDAIEKNLKLLRKTTQETITTSTYGAIMELL